MHISYINFIFLCLAASVGLQLFIRKKKLALLDVRQWIETDLEGDISDSEKLEDHLKKQIYHCTFRLVLRAGWLSFGVIVLLSAFSVLPAFPPSFGIIILFLVAHIISIYIVPPYPEDLRRALKKFLKENQFQFVLNNLEVPAKVYRFLDNATHEQAKQLIQAFKDTERAHLIPIYLKKLLNSFLFENQLMGLEHLYLVTPDKELELLIFAYHQEANRFKGEKDVEDPSAGEFRFLYHLVPNKLEYVTELLTRIVFHRNLNQNALISLGADGMGRTLRRMLPITPLKLALSDHPILVSIGFSKLTDQELYIEAFSLIESLKELNNISHLVTGVLIAVRRGDETEYKKVITPHERVLELAQSKVLNEGIGERMRAVLRHVELAKFNQYYCKTCSVKSDVLNINRKSYPVCPECKRLDGLELSVSFPVIVGVIGLKEYTVHPEKKEIHIPVWNEAERKALNTKIEVLEIWEAENLSYDWAINAVVNIQLNLQPDVRIPVRLVGNPPLSQNSRLILKIPTE